MTIASRPYEAGLPRYGILPTWFEEFNFQFESTLRTTTYDTQDAPGTDPATNPLGGTY
jgi:hypothetical protein